MKILYINSNTPDYLSDSLFHGFYNLFDEDFIYLHDYDGMFVDNYDFIKHYPKHFTLYGNLIKKYNNNNDIEYKIRKHYFDFIIYGNIRRHNDYLNLVIQHYKKSEICFIDGEDRCGISELYDPKIIYFKRELCLDIENFPFKNIYPISFSIPKEKIINYIPIKEKMISNIIPGDLSSYIYNNELDYYNEYRKSYFAITKKKAGWDCLRHYEILMNYCLPYFENLEECPTNIMVKLPKKELINVKKIYHDFSEKTYYEILNIIFEYTKNNLTTENSAKHIVDKIIQNN
jgi:hypothetical protein